MAVDWPDGTTAINVDGLVKLEINGEVKYAVIEAKGGSSTLGKRLAKDKDYAEQGSQEYHDSLVRDMEAKYIRMSLILGKSQSYYSQLAEMQNVITILKSNTVEYHLFSHPLMDAHGNASQVKYTLFNDLTPGG